MTKKQRVLSIVLASLMLGGTLSGCGGGDEVVSIDKENPAISIMTMASSSDSATDESPVTKALEEHVGADLIFKWIPTTGYDEKVTATMGANSYPHVMLVNTITPSIINASRKGRFWDLTEKLTDAEKFPNLAQSDPNINHNISIDGHVYGVYRAREIGRSGITIRKDWLDNLGMEMPETVDDLYNVLKAFKEQDPDKNGQNDTYGMIVTTYLDGPLDNLAIWMGAPNQWGVDEATGELVPDFTTQEYFDALNFMRKCYAEGLINADMATYVPDEWDQQFLTEKAGVIIDVASRARRIAENMQGLNPNAIVEVIGYVKKDENSEPRTRPTTGYSGYYVIPKASVKTEEELDIVLGILDKACDPEAVDLLNLGIEGRNYNLVDGGYAEKIDDTELVKEYNDLNQFTMINLTNTKTKYSSNLAEKVDEVYAENRKYVVTNIAEPYVSDTYTISGPQLDAIMAEANTKYIIGDITEDEWRAQVERWKSMGGDKVIKEINEAYKKDDLAKK